MCIQELASTGFEQLCQMSRRINVNLLPGEGNSYDPVHLRDLNCCSVALNASESSSVEF